MIDPIELEYLQLKANFPKADLRDLDQFRKLRFWYSFKQIDDSIREHLKENNQL